MCGIQKKRPDTQVNHIGVELEVLSRHGSGVRDPSLVSAFANSPLNRIIELHYENHGFSGYGYEASFCAPESDYKAPLREMVALLVANECKVGCHLGLHVHLDGRNRVYREMESALRDQQQNLNLLIARRRLSEAGWSPAFVVGREGYETVEVRMKEATFDVPDIIRWIDTLIGIVNAPVAVAA